MTNKLLLDIICGAGIIISGIAGTVYAAKSDCPDIVGRASLATLLISGTGAVYNNYRRELENMQEPEYYI